MTVSASPAGATFDTASAENRSITIARAKMELAISGQIGHPAACMMENKMVLPVTIVRAQLSWIVGPVCQSFAAL
jgi:hypothetical protein